MLAILVIQKRLNNINYLKICFLKRMSKEETIDKLIEFVTKEPNEKDSENRKFLYIKKVPS